MLFLLTPSPSSQVSKSDGLAVDNNKSGFDPDIEPLLKENPRRFVVLPIEYPDIWQMYKKAEGKRDGLRNGETQKE